jgi:DNA-binding transcriptional MocR family regulator
MKRYEALAHEIEEAILGGVLRPGDRLPSVRQASKTRRVSPSTVFQAYYLLEARGLVRPRVRSGYFVLPRTAVLPPVQAPSRPADTSQTVRISNFVFDALEAAGRRNCVPFGSPFPDPTLFPLAQLGRSVASAARSFTARSTLDDLTPGKEGLRRQIAQRYLGAGVSVHPDCIVITNGALEALNLCLTAVTRPGDAVVVESPAWYGVLQAIERRGLRAVEVATHPERGVDLGRLEHAIRQHKAKACWLMPNFQNPLGATMPDDSKRDLVEIITRHGIPLIEDDAYGELHFGDARPRPAKHWDKEGLVMHCSSFSKCLAPGYRIGWVAPGRYMREVAQLKIGTSISTSAPSQLGLLNYLQYTSFDRHLRQLRQALAQRHREFAHAVGRHFPEGSYATRPQGGYCIWLQLAATADTLELHRYAQSRGICVAPGAAFSTGRAFTNCMRLNFSYGLTERADRALQVLGRYVQRAADTGTVALQRQA